MFNSFSASTIGPHVDNLFFWLLLLCGGILLSIVVVTTYFLVKYRRGSPADRSRPQDKNFRLEMSIAASFTVVMFGIFIWSSRDYFNLHTPPSDAMEIFVMSKQWMWKFQHPNGRTEVNELHVPVNKAVKLVLSSDDVIHSLYIPDFRIKQDALPGRYTSTWFEAVRSGTYDVLCSQYCGTEHAHMLATIIVMEAQDYENWSKGMEPSKDSTKVQNQDQVLLQKGADLFAKNACLSCHSIDKNSPNDLVAKIAPPLNGIFGEKVQLIHDEVVLADENYIRESITDPNAKIVAGYNPVMPTYKTILKDDELAALVLYIKNLGAAR